MRCCVELVVGAVLLVKAGLPGFRASEVLALF